MICDECETVAHCMKNGCVPKQSAQLDLPDFIAGALGVSRGTAYDMMREALAEESSGTEQPAQRTWVGLTDEEIEDCYGGEINDFARAIEAKLKEKNNG